MIHILRLNDAYKKNELDNLTNLLDIIDEIKIRDWTGLCAQRDNIKDM